MTESNLKKTFTDRAIGTICGVSMVAFILMGTHGLCQSMVEPHGAANGFGIVIGLVGMISAFFAGPFTYFAASRLSADLRKDPS